MLEKEEITRMLHEFEVVLSNGDHFMNKWEENYIESIIDQFKEIGALSVRQQSLLDKLYWENINDK